MNRVLWTIAIVFIILVGLYPLMYFVVDVNFGLLESKSDELLANRIWKTGFLLHISFGGMALLSGFSQFSKRIRAKRIKLHRQLGKIYVVTALISGIAGVYIGFYATGGIISSTGFILLGLTWIYASTKAYLKIKKKDIVGHERFMYYSYAACFAAVTLRIWLPLLTMSFGFMTGYKIVAWLCWVPNVLVAHWLISKLPSQQVRKKVVTS